MRFDQIEQAVLRGDVDCGVLIHEGRFTYQAKGLTLLEDLGAVWETRMKCPLPLAAIAIRRDLVAEHGIEIDARASRQRRIRVRASGSEPRICRCSTRRKWIPSVVAQHIQLYVNDYTIAARRTRGASRCSTGSSERGTQRRRVVFVCGLFRFYS